MKPQSSRARKNVAFAIDQLTIGVGHRNDLGDIPALARSIMELGLLYPIGITPAGELIFGRRRLGGVHAARREGILAVPIFSPHRAESIDKCCILSHSVADYHDDQNNEDSSDRSAPRSNRHAWVDSAGLAILRKLEIDFQTGPAEGTGVARDSGDPRDLADQAT
jgi:hypothetical protein